MKYYYNTTIGPLSFFEKDGLIVKISFSTCEVDEDYKETILIKNAYLEIEEYLLGNRKTFTFPFKIKGTEFEQKVYRALLEIPYGETRSYKDIAIAIENENSFRAVGLANNKNNLPIVVPCHRVIGKTGKLVGYAGGLNIKKRLLLIENPLFV